MERNTRQVAASRRIGITGGEHLSQRDASLLSCERTRVDTRWKNWNDESTGRVEYEMDRNGSHWNGLLPHVRNKLYFNTWAIDRSLQE